MVIPEPIVPLNFSTGSFLPPKKKKKRVKVKHLFFRHDGKYIGQKASEMTWWTLISVRLWNFKDGGS